MPPADDLDTDDGRLADGDLGAGRLADRRLTGAGHLFVTERHLAILSTPSVGGRIHSVPVGFTLEDGILRIITSDRTQKVRNIERAGHATVAQVAGRQWISLDGSARIERTPDAVAHAVALYSARYREPSVNPIRVVIEVTVTGVLASPGLVEH